jgi:hypothetical protein
MSSRGLNVCTLAGSVISIDTRTSDHIEIVINVDNRHKEGSFVVRVIIWNDSLASHTVPHIREGSLIIVTGSIEPSPYISEYDDQPYAGLRLTATDIFLDGSPRNQYKVPVLSDDLPSR